MIPSQQLAAAAGAEPRGLVTQALSPARVVSVVPVGLNSLPGRLVAAACGPARGPGPRRVTR